MDADYVDEIVLLANTPSQAETLLHSLEQAAVPHKATAIWSLTTHHEKLSKLDKPDMQDTAGEVETNS